ncbi:epidermal retinol dehydrogenase 2-like isoform X2 [Tachypleus tridentatus]
MSKTVAAIVKAISTTSLVIYLWLEAIFFTFVPKRFRFKDVSKEIVLITGGGSGIGRLLALRFGKLGAKVVLWDINRQSCEETELQVRELGGEAFTYTCDVSDQRKVSELASLVKREVGNVTILVNNAGIVTGKPIMDCSVQEINRIFEVNAISHFWTTKSFLQDMMAANHGHIVSIASLAGLGGVVGLTDYCASKFAVVGLEDALRLELKAGGYKGIKSTLVCPFFINTGMFAGAKPGVFEFLEPEYVADEIMAAVLINQEILILPKLFNFLLILKS